MITVSIPFFIPIPVPFSGNLSVSDNKRTDSPFSTERNVRSLIITTALIKTAEELEARFFNNRNRHSSTRVERPSVREL